MRSALLTIFLVACGNSGTSSGDDTMGPDANMPSDSSGGDASNGDGSADGPAVSYAPCDTCCDPIAQDCGPAAACHPNSGGGGNVTTCKAEGAHQLGGTCVVDTDCVKGTTCLTDDFGAANARCYKICVSDSECSAYPSTAHTCTLFPAQAGRASYGLCYP